MELLSDYSTYKASIDQVLNIMALCIRISWCIIKIYMEIILECNLKWKILVLLKTSHKSLEVHI